MKYVVFRNFGMVIFEPHIHHSTIVGMVSHDEVVSAGFVKMDDDGPYCYGKSTSLDGLASRPEQDTALLKRRLDRYRL